jgi:hypothetical protein
MKRNSKTEQIIEMWKQGNTPAQIIKKTGMSPSYVYKICSDYKNKPKPKAKVKSLTMSEIGLRDALAKARGEPPLTFKVATPISFTTSNKSINEHIKDVTDMVNNPPHYTKGGIDTIDFIEAKKLGYNLGNVIKYVTRSEHKGSMLEDLEKAQWYLNREINNLKK